MRVFDPVAGRGTTLNRALIAGYDATGVELSASDVDQYRAFIVNYLRGHRIKHQVEREQIRKGPLAGTERCVVHIGRAPRRPQQRVEIVNGDTTRADAMFPAASFDVLVADLPYGVQHRATPGAEALAGRRTPTRAARRQPARLAHRAARRSVAHPRRGTSARCLAPTSRRCSPSTSFEVVEHPRSFEHVVDRSITRDVIVARK